MAEKRLFKSKPLDRKKFIRKPELQDLLTYFREERQFDRYLMVRLASHLGLRVTEAAHMKVEDLSRVRGERIVIAAKKNQGQKPRRRKRRYAKLRALREAIESREMWEDPVSKLVRKEILSYLKHAGLDPKVDEGWLFPGRFHGFPTHVSTIHRWFVQACLDCGIGYKTFHCLRHFCGFDTMQRKKDITKVARRLRHSSLEMARRYAQMTPDEELDLADDLDFMMDDE